MTEHSSQHHLVVRFVTNQANQDQALKEIGDYVANFLSRQPGFISSQLLASRDGLSIVHHAVWTSQEAFDDAAAKARDHPDLGKLMVYQPEGVEYRLARSF